MPFTKKMYLQFSLIENLLILLNNRSIENYFNFVRVDMRSITSDKKNTARLFIP